MRHQGLSYYQKYSEESAAIDEKIHFLEALRKLFGELMVAEGKVPLIYYDA